MQETNSLASCFVPWVFWVFFPFPFDFTFPVRLLSMAWIRGLSLFSLSEELDNAEELGSSSMSPVPSSSSNDSTVALLVMCRTIELEWDLLVQENYGKEPGWTHIKWVTKHCHISKSSKFSMSENDVMYFAKCCKKFMGMVVNKRVHRERIKAV